ncbi:G patch domain and ankyrin repeat-containing protein 1 homolog [Lepeophtheirus salmonis]|uniref:G patch domain and ankyrin repeat-containing protein 1 homolog n=1 Tax=Lepeophtheirus salmonis TaxID=72036 RepID=UPI001AE728D0|nr:G patch domain and ankyrin repeat-containing protein 1 homolog [Lepeophtheirus salmonis]
MSSIHYFPKTNFVKAKDSDNKTSSINKGNSESNISNHFNGNEVRNFYDSLFSSSSNEDSNTVDEDDDIQIIAEITPTVVKFNIKDLFLAIDNDSDFIEDIIKQGVDINVIDSYGWTPLMHAISSGNLRITQLFLNKGANPTLTKDKGGWSCQSLAEKQGGEILRLISEGPHFITTPCSCLNETKPSYDCELCHQTFEDKKVHTSSIIHNFRYNMHCDSSKPKSTYYGISENNRGYELMLKKGWNPEKGLGPSCSGKLYPVKTVLKKDRSGIGNTKERARVTHFGPGDISSVADRRSRVNPKGNILSKKIMKRKISMDKKKNAIYRRELSDL